MAQMLRARILVRESLPASAVDAARVMRTHQCANGRSLGRLADGLIPRLAAIFLTGLGLAAPPLVARAAGPVVSGPSGPLLVQPSVPAAADTAAPAPGDACEQAGRAAEAAFGIPSGLLLAIGRVESGRLSPTGRIAAWPWAVDVAGQGALLPSRAAALATIRAARAAGQTNIDVGCFQVNLGNHPDAFPSLEAALDPATNATYAAGLLARLRTQLGDWGAAAAAYHSQTPSLGQPYLLAVLRNWDAGGPAAATRLAMMATGPVGRLPATAWVAVAAVHGVRVISPGEGPRAAPDGLARIVTPVALDVPSGAAAPAEPVVQYGTLPPGVGR